VTYAQSHPAIDTAVDTTQELSDDEIAVADVQQANVEDVGHKLVFKN
jgi:hypothetical protein